MLSSLALWSILFLGGHVIGALSFYFFHRFIFHGTLGKLPVLRSWKAQHTAHHASPEDPGHFFFPAWANAIIWVGTAAMAWVVPAFGLGLFSFFGVYAYRHRKAHLGTQSRWAHHHMSHHFANPRANFSGTYPIFDMFLGSYKPIPVPVQSRDRRR